MSIYTKPPNAVPASAPIYPTNGTDTYATHQSHFGLGGYTELPTLTDLYNIPVREFTTSDGYGSGRRKYGMIVYVMSEDKWFQLRPRNKSTGEYLTLSQFEALTPVEEKIIVLNPTAFYYDTDENLVNGSGDATECWTELCLSCGNLEIIDVYASKTFTTEDANKIFHFHTGSSSNLTATVHTSCAAGFNLAVNNVGTGFLSLPGALGVSTVLDARHSGAFMYKSASAVYAVGRL